MQHFLPTFVWRHRKENLQKCSLRGLEDRPDFRFFRYPQEPLPDLSSHVLLTLGAPVLSREDAGYGLLLIDGTWRYAETMVKQVTHEGLILRTLPADFRTAYPRKQTNCPDPHSGLASIEALFVAYHILGRDTAGLLDRYHWKDEFLRINSLILKRVI